MRSPAGARRSTVMAAATHSHRAKVHDPDDQGIHQTETAAAAVEAEVQAVPPGRPAYAGSAWPRPGASRQ